MSLKFDKSCHSVYTLQYHLIQCVEHRRRVFDNEKIVDFLKQKIHEISQTFDVDVLCIECDKDYFHMIFKTKPTLNIPKYLNTIKTITSREIRKKFPQVKKKLWNEMFWSRSYFLTTTGQATLDVLKKYVESQMGNVKKL